MLPLFRNSRFGFFKTTSSDKSNHNSFEPRLPYSWILSGRLAVGPMPRTQQHWEQLEAAGFRRRFSCCYPEEHVFAPIPTHWTSTTKSMPDHRNQELLTKSMLLEILHSAETLLLESKEPVYLHCYAGQERSTLVAVGLTYKLKSVSIFEALEWVRRCHPVAKPLYSQLVILEELIANNRNSLL